MALVVNSDEMAGELAGLGAAKVLKVNNDAIGPSDAGQYAKVLEAAIKEFNPSGVLIGGTNMGNDIAPRLASVLQTGAITDASELWVSDGNICAKRIIYGGNAVGSFMSKGPVSIVTVAQGAYERPAGGSGGQIVDFSPDPGPGSVNLVNSVRKELGSVNLKDAEVIVSVGRGLKNKEDLQLARDLTAALGGELGCSRPIAADLEWLPAEHWVGLSGIKVKPRIYITLGISGQIQHLAGMRDSDTIIAVNTDPDAPIFQAADYGIVGDLYKVVPELIQLFKK